MKKITVKILETKKIFQSYIFELVQQKFELNGKLLERDLVFHPGAVVILPIDQDGNILFIRQYRHAIQQTILEIPAGTLEVGEEPMACARREIQEEVGHSAKVWREMGVIHPAPGFCNEVQHFYVATELTPETLPQDEDEIIEVEKIHKTKWQSFVASGEITDAKTLAALLKAQQAGLI